ncbi:MULTISPECIES: DUF742 domain-containing protein [unclassified Streptomyces]|uniref:DUF742 domain-containing protein n=1 Tax=unclassified Streptomyces TaxID=2593676 RepID=UPI002ED248FE|nr:DUF742 domain-containing protein [Streptomyces sp. NBC_00891]WSY08003.1 DUF742 domain-containing protein [Streptomyces sp. NBC_00890]WSZ09628.1 DUF742 domain-containing protein [Streptomyces sp. NBC_00869]WSZ22872.1 DUF742 domain-containing protein [Streptomyces sp. NBC_00870]
MGTPPGGHQYDGDRHVPGEHGDERFNFPSTPGRQGAQQPQQPYRPYAQQQQYGGAGHDDWPQQEPQQPAQQPPHHPRRPHRFDAPQQQPRIQPVQPRRPSEPAAPAAHNPLVRPYAMTGGRTRPRYQLAIEALVSTTADPSRLQGQLPEHQRICRLCFEIKSVAEISALLSIPLGVARILVADLAEAGLVAIHQPGGDESAGGQPDVTLLERVLSGLRKL